MQPASEHSDRGSGIVTVFGGTGFLGHRVVRHLLDCNFKVPISPLCAKKARVMFPIGDVRGL